MLVQESFLREHLKLNSGQSAFFPFYASVLMSDLGPTPRLLQGKCLQFLLLLLKKCFETVIP